MADGSPLTREQRDELRAELERELERLRRSMPTTEAAARPVQLDQSAIGRLSRVDAMQNQAMQHELHDRERHRENELMSALERMDDGSYGLCARCGQPVPYGRLLVVPEARNCVACGGGA